MIDITSMSESISLTVTPGGVDARGRHELGDEIAGYDTKIISVDTADKLGDGARLDIGIGYRRASHGKGRVNGDDDIVLNDRRADGIVIILAGRSSSQ